MTHKARLPAEPTGMLQVRILEEHVELLKWAAIKAKLNLSSYMRLHVMPVWAAQHKGSTPGPFGTSKAPEPEAPTSAAIEQGSP